MEETEDYSDIRLKSWCIHCGDSLSKVGWTEDHVPTKSLLQKPRPHHLPVIKVCPACNNSFSKDEQYFVTFLSCVMAGSTDPEVQFIPSAARALRSSPSLRAAIENARSVGPNREDASPTWSPDVARVHRVILKNARGHAFFERGEPVTDAPVSIIAVPLSTLSEQVRVWFEREAVQGALASWPEAGSRLMHHIATGHDMLGGWIVVQPELYRYSLEKEDGGLVVRSVIWNYLATEVRWMDT
ncbi:hypothetical protein [Sinorhizobium meliloti]|uniref:hypothetical protein n=1 Tax=Rhizobium meliloti TaxID=382 RepID=UPI0020905382|nr:hypothetical protein [Sinorhizobium meliloti]MCO5966323.1 hypothetical protein [Sinorhizobium meliloti]